MEYIQDFKNLELPLGASKDDIKSAYRRLSKKYHPDKNKNCDYSEFIKISESYKRLMNIYNYKIDIEDYEFYISNYISIIKYLYEVIRDKLIENTSNWFTQKETDEKTNENTKDIIVNLDVNLIDIYNCEVKKVVIKVLRKDNNNLIVKKEDFYISLFDFKNQYIFKNKADDSFSKNNGDIIINVNINNNNRYYIKNEKNQKYNLYYDMDITLSEYLFGINKSIKILDMYNNIINVNNNKLYENKDIVISNKGLIYKNDEKYFRGDFIIKFTILNKSEKNLEFKNNPEFKNLICKYF
tara:strand:+ start:8763 stop:9653 length:891 start_codon:yes stop_codon:yes gene_type:complete